VCVAYEFFWPLEKEEVRGKNSPLMGASQISIGSGDEMPQVEHTQGNLQQKLVSSNQHLSKTQSTTRRQGSPHVGGWKSPSAGTGRAIASTF
jgi:hypothetical protein